jgi:hypothetical protein
VHDRSANKPQRVEFHALHVPSSMKPRTWIVKTLWTTVILLAVVGVDAVIRRVLVLLWPIQFGGHFASAQALDSNFARHPALTLAHIGPGLSS